MHGLDDLDEGNLLMNRALRALLLTTVLTTSVAEARVFWRWKTSGADVPGLEALGGTRAYSSRVTINGAGAQLDVIQFDQPISRVIRQFRDSVGGTVEFRNGSLARVSQITNQQALQLVLLELENGRRTLVFRMEQTAQEYEQSRQPPAAHPIAELPEYPGSSPLFFVANSDTDLKLLVTEAAALPPDIQRFYRDALTGAGWSPVLPAARNSTPSRLVMYQRGPELCGVFVEPDGHTRGRITLLHKVTKSI
jgi:hypothetical protein